MDARPITNLFSQGWHTAVFVHSAHSAETLNGKAVAEAKTFVLAGSNGWKVPVLWSGFMSR